MRFRCLIGILFLMTLKGSEGGTQATYTSKKARGWHGDLKTCYPNVEVANDENFTISTAFDRETLAVELKNKEGVKFLPTNLFSVFPDLLEFQVSECSITTISENHFKNLSKLLIVYLGNNKIEHVASDAFADLVSLETLHLGFNKIQSLSADPFSSLKNLKRLYLNDNKIQHLDRNIFKSLKIIEDIALSGNSIEALDGKIFASLTNLREIFLHKNKLQEIPGNLFQNNLKLKKIELYQNEIKLIDANMFDHLLDLNSIDLRSNLCVNENYVKESFDRMRSDLKQNCETQPRAAACGVPRNASGLIVEGQNFPHGAFPWIVALMLTKSRPPEYFCAGTLISETYVISAAHCILNKGAASAFLARDILAIFGAHDLDNPTEPERITRSPIKIFIHKDWNNLETSYDADISLLKFQNGKITFSDFIQPICLWNSETEPAVTTGVVTGWGKSVNKTKIHENLPKLIPAPILSNEKCFLDDPGLIDISSERTFCAGLRNGSGVCSGDSGGGLFIKINKVYHLKGIVSSSLFTYQGCDISRYAVYTNVLKFKRWIRKKSQQTIEG